MADYKVVKDLMEIKSPGCTKATTEPTTVQLLHFKKTLVSALAKCPLNASNKGHSYIIETLAEHQARNNNPGAILPFVPTVPTRPTGRADCAELTFYSQTVSEYNAHIEYNAQALAVIRSTFPGILSGLMIDGDLPDDTTGSAALVHAFNTVLDSMVSRTSYLDLSKAIYARVYLPSITGPVSYFAECDNDNLMMIRMKRAPHEHELIMECALAAFAAAHTNTIDSFRTYEAEWNIKKVTLVFTGTTYAEFKIFFTNKLKFLYTDQRGAHHQANHADILINRVAALEHNLADMSMVQDKRIEDLESAYHGSARAPPDTAFCLPRDNLIIP